MLSGNRCHLAKVFELLLISLDESPILADSFIVFTCLPGEPKLGLCLDIGMSPAHSADALIRNPENMAKYQSNPLDPYFIDSWDHGIRKSISIHNNNSTLFESFKKLVKANSEVERKKKGLALLTTRLKDFNLRWHAQKSFPIKVDLKIHFIQLIQHFFCDLSIYFGMEEGNSLDIIDQLDHVFDPSTRAILKNTVEQLHALRIDLHQFYKGPKTFLLFYDSKNNKNNLKVASSKQQEMLEGIYLLILKPLYLMLSFVLETEPSKAKNLFEKMGGWFSGPVKDNLTDPIEKFEYFFKKINLVDFCFNSFYDSNDLSDHQKKRVVAYSAKVLCQLHIKEPMPQLIYIYQKLSTIAYQDDILRKTFLEVVEKYLPEMAAQIAPIPNQEGFRRSWQSNMDRFQADIAHITMNEPHRDHKVLQVQMTTPKGKFYLKPDVIKQIIDDDGNIIKYYKNSSRHNVSFAGSLHFKQKPYLPLKEFAVHNFKSRCFGSLSPESQLVLFEVERGGLLSNIRYPVLISQTIEGETLEQNQKIDWESCDQAQWTREFISEVLIPPGDGSTHNYIYQKKGHSIFGIDHDLSWVEPVWKVNFFKVKVNFCSALFCLFPNVALDPTALQDFCHLNQDHIFISWMKDVIKKEEEYRALFSEEDLKEWRQDKTPTTFDTTFTFREGTLETLAILFSQIQNYIRTSLANNKPVTPLDLLSKLIHMKRGDINKGIGEKVAYCYRHADNHYPLNDQLTWITERDSAKTLSSLQSAQAIQGEIPSDQSINDAKKMTPNEALNELAEFSLKHEKAVLYNKSLVEVNFESTSLDKQKTRLTYLKFLMEEHKLKPKKVVLHYCEVLDSDLLLYFLNDQLEHLDLRYCTKIKDEDISKIANIAPNLRELYLGGSPNLNCIWLNGWFGNGPLKFSKLKVLHIEACDQLAVICIETPLVETIICKNNKSLKTFEVTSFPIDKIYPDTLSSVIKVQCDDMTKRNWYELRKNDEEFILHGLGRDGMSLALCHVSIRNQLKYVKQAIQNEKEALYYASDRVAWICISHDCKLIQYATEQLQLNYLELHPQFLSYASDGVIDHFLASNGLALEHAGLYQDDEISVLCAVNQNGLALQYASGRLRNKLKVVIAAMLQNRNAYNMASSHMQKHPTVVDLQKGYIYYLIRYCLRNTGEEERDDTNATDEESGLMVYKDDMS